MKQPEVEDSSEARKGGGFAPTPWTIVMTAGAGATSESAEALERLCRAYWPPVFAHLRCQGFTGHQAEDLAQEFFSRLLRSNAFAAVSPEKGRFRTFLLAALRHFLINEWKRERRLKRGGGVVIVDLDALEPAVRDACEPRDSEDPELAYDRQWALAVLSKGHARLRREYEAAGQLDRHEALRNCLLDNGSESYTAVAERLGLSDAAVKSAIHRMRRRFGELLKAEVTRTVGDERDVADELRHLLRALRGSLETPACDSFLKQE